MKTFVHIFQNTAIFRTWDLFAIAWIAWSFCEQLIPTIGALIIKFDFPKIYDKLLLKTIDDMLTPMKQNKNRFFYEFDFENIWHFAIDLNK